MARHEQPIKVVGGPVEKPPVDVCVDKDGNVLSPEQVEVQGGRS